MKHPKSYRRTREFFDLFFSNKKAAITYFVILPLLILASDKGWSIEANMKGLGFTLSDACILLTRPILFGITIVPLFVFLISVLLKYDFNSTGIIRRKSRQGLWLKQVGNICAFSALAALYLTFCSGIISIFITKDICNWNEKHSFFFSAMLAQAATDKSGTVIPQTIAVPPSIVEISGMLFLFSFFSIAVMSIIVLLIKWLSESYVIGFASIIMIALLDWYSVPVFYTYSSISYEQWVKNVPVICNILYPAIWIFALTTIGWIFSKRKDFLSVQQK